MDLTPLSQIPANAPLELLEAEHQKRDAVVSDLRKDMSDLHDMMEPKRLRARALASSNNPALHQKLEAGVGDAVKLG